MTKMCLLLLGVVGAFGQITQNAGIVYQQAGVITLQTAGGRVIVNSFAGGSGPALFGPETVTGSPFSATQQSHSLQVLGDGTRIERTETQQVYRDNMGRTRIEGGQAGSETITIQDPVSGVTAVMNPAAKTAKTAPASRVKFTTPGNPANGIEEYSYAYTTTAKGQVLAGAAGRPISVASLSSGQGGGGLALNVEEGAASSKAKPLVEDLAAQNVNGVLATGRRTTMTIPAGEIGNDRPIQVTSETWYSSDLQMMVKSSSSDPRFGDSSFELTNIVRTEPDPSLFQIPADYTVIEPKTLPARGKE